MIARRPTTRAGAAHEVILRPGDHHVAGEAIPLRRHQHAGAVLAQGMERRGEAWPLGRVSSAAHAVVLEPGDDGDGLASRPGLDLRALRVGAEVLILRRHAEVANSAQGVTRS